MNADLSGRTEESIKTRAAILPYLSRQYLLGRKIVSLIELLFQFGLQANWWCTLNGWVVQLVEEFYSTEAWERIMEFVIGLHLSSMTLKNPMPSLL